MQEFFTQNIAEIFFVYGLSFFSMGFAILLELGHAQKMEFARALRPLGWFGIVHGSHEWIEMILILHKEEFAAYTYILAPLRIVMLATSFILLLMFGFQLISGQTRGRLQLIVIGAAIGIWLLGILGLSLSQLPTSEQQTAMDVYTRYALAIPGALLAGAGLMVQQRRFTAVGMTSFAWDVTLAAIAFWVYGLIGQFFASPSHLFPSTIVNTNNFLAWFGFPIQLLRAAMACMAAIFIVRSLRAFEVETAHQIESLRDAQLQERTQLEQLRNELLHRTVTAQEAERSRIARELHDETGQALTAISIGLRSLKENISKKTSRPIQQAVRLEDITNSSLLELQRMVAGLHPAQLDDLGLLAALRWYAGDVSHNSSLKIEIASPDAWNEPSEEVRITLYRIVQEAITNVVRHAQANQVRVTFTTQEGQMIMKIIDDGCGFDTAKIKMLSRKDGASSLGLMGMQERAMLIAGECEIISTMGQGTTVLVRFPIPQPREQQ